MADNVAITAGSGTTIAADDISSVFYQRVKVAHGADGSATDTSSAAPLPVQASLETSQIMAAGASLVPKFAAIAASSSGNNTLVAAVTSKKVRVLAVSFVANAAVNAKFQSGASGTDLTGLFYCLQGGGAVLPFNPVGWFETGSNTLLNLNLSGAVAVGGCLVYVEV